MSKFRIGSFVCLIIVAIVVIASIFLYNKPVNVELPETDTITEIQLDAVKIDCDRFDSQKLEDIIRNIEAAKPESQREDLSIPVDGNYFVIAFLDEKQQQDRFYFYCVDDQYYMQTESGDLYSNVDFIKEYLVGDFGWIPAPKGAVAGTAIPEQTTVSYAIDTNYDIRYWLYTEILLKKMEGMSEEDAISGAKATLLVEYKLYQYAIQNNCEIPEDLYIQLVESRIKEAKEQESYADVEQVYETAGTSLEQHIRQTSEMIWRVEDTIDYMKHCFHDEFRKGNYIYNEVEYDSAGEYGDAKMIDIIFHKLEDIDISDFEKKLMEAEEYYQELGLPEEISSQDQENGNIVYSLLVNDNAFDESGVVTVSGNSFVLQYAVEYSEEAMLDSRIVEEEALSGNWHEHILSVEGNYVRTGRDGTTVSTIEYQFADVPSGSEIVIEISDELATRIGLTTTMLKIEVE